MAAPTTPPPTRTASPRARTIALVDQRHVAAVAPPFVRGALAPAGGPLADRRGRPLRDLRISVTDRCNFRCGYCMPKAVFGRDHHYLPHDALLTFEEITRLARVFLGHGVGKIRLTGGEPLLRRHLETLVEQLAALRTEGGGPPDLTLTTNGALLGRKARALKAAGLQRVTVSLDALDDAVFRAMNDVDFPVADVLRGIDAARDAGLGLRADGSHGGLKVNMVVKRSTNAEQIVPMARHFRGSGVTLRFIEYMDVGATNGWRLDEVVPSAEVVQRLLQDAALVPLPATTPGETARRWGYADTQGRHDPALGEIGVVSSVTQAFCGDCNRARLSTEGRLYLCLFASQGHDLRGLLRSGADDATLAAAVAHIWQGRDDRYSELRAGRTAPADATSPAAPKASGNRVEMSYIGG